MEREEKETNQRDLRVKFTQRLPKSCHGQLARPNLWKAEMEDSMGQKIKAESS